MKTDDLLHPVLEKLSKKYECIKRLGGGEYSNVFLVKQFHSGKEQALKILDYYYILQKIKKNINLPDSKVKFNEIKTRFILEANLYKKIDHPNIVKIREMGVFEDEKEGIEIPYFLMDYVKGSSLDKVIKNEAPFSLEKAMRISQNILSALDIIHQNNIIHRDLKPGNIMIEEDTGNAILIDFGIAKDIVDEQGLTITGSLLGTPLYMAPEQFLNSSKVGPETDIYSFGVVLYEMLTGESPFKGSNFLEIQNAHRSKPIPSVHEKNPGLPEGLDFILARVMAKDHINRYKSVKDLDNALKRIDDHKPSRKFIKYIILTVITALIAAFLLLDPLHLLHKKNDTPKDRVKIELNKMKEDYENLKALLQGGAVRHEKIAKCREFLTDYSTGPYHNEIAAIVNQLENETDNDERYTNFIRSAKKYLDANDFEKAAKDLGDAKKIKDTDEIKLLLQTLQTKKTEFDTQNGTTEFNAIKETLNLDKYLEFKKKYPPSVYIADLKEKLKKANSKLPPEKYWDKPLKPNQKGYYELTFDREQNAHTMVYIPERKFWIDKYEVSNLQFKRFLEAERIPPPPQRQNNIINGGDDYPVVVSYAEAERYCQEFGMRLPTLEEWEYIAGKDNYPWGSEPPNAGGIAHANYDSMEGTEEKDGFPGTSPVKSFERFLSPFGAANMAGNVLEWVKGRQLKGGSFFSPGEDIMIRKTVQGRNTDKEGFRSVKDENE